MKEKAQKIALVAIPALLALVLFLVVHARGDDERKLAAYLLANSHEDDLVIFVSSDFDKMHRLGRRKVLFSDAVHWDDVMSHDVAWVVGPHWIEVPMLGRVTVEDVGPYRVHRIDLASHSVKKHGYHLLRHLHEASVHRMGEKIDPCPHRSGIFACEGEPWFSVNIQRVLMGGIPFECIYAHPRDGSALVIVFPETPGGRSIYLEGGIDDDGVYFPGGAQVTVRVEARGREMARASFDNVPGVQERHVVFEEPLAGPVPLVVRVTSPNQDTRHFCFAGWLEPVKAGK